MECPGTGCALYCARKGVNKTAEIAVGKAFEHRDKLLGKGTGGTMAAAVGTKIGEHAGRSIAVAQAQSCRIVIPGVPRVAGIFGAKSGAAVGSRCAAGAASWGIGIAGLVGDYVGSKASGVVAKQCSATPQSEHYCRKGGGATGSIGASALAGACVGGPVGAAAGAGIGAVGWIVGEVVGYATTCDNRHKFGSEMIHCEKCGVPTQDRGCRACCTKLCISCYDGHAC